MFVVFGKSKVKARENAIKNISHVPESIGEYTEKIDKRAAEFYENAKCVKIRPVYSNIDQAK